MKALTFLEWYFTQKGNYRWYDNQNEFINHTYKVLDFYNQPFTLDMLLNPVMADGVNIKPLIQQSESLRLFEGWEIDNEVRCYRCYDGEQYSKYPIVHFNGYEGLTLNDFITIFSKYNKGKLNFNKSNETIKKLFGKE